jgi:hypothetical protein
MNGKINFNVQSEVTVLMSNQVQVVQALDTFDSFTTFIQTMTAKPSGENLLA